MTAARLRESDWTRTVIEAATLHGWRVAHFRPARTARGYRTPVQGHTGSPDLLLARGGVVICAELKTATGRLRPEQADWLDQLGAHGRLWRPADLDDALTELRRPS